MKPKTNLIVNSICFVLVSPLLGIMVTGLIVGVLLVVLYIIILILGFASSISFDVNLSSFSHRWARILDVASYLIIIVGSFGGLVWSFIEIKSRWLRHKKDGAGW